MIEPQPDLALTSAEAEQILEAWLGTPTRCSAIVRLEGGMMNSVFRLEFDQSPQHAVVKLHGASGDPFAAEAGALEYLQAETTCPAPEVYLHDSSRRLSRYAFLLIEHVPGVCLKDLDLEPHERDDVEAQLADVLVELHRHEGQTWGDLDGSQRATSWADVFAGRLADARAHPEVAERLDDDVLAAVDQAIDMARPALADAGRPTLIHGDIWEGNLMVRLEDGRWRLTGLLDPSLQFADVECELAYLEVFDHQRTAFFASYTAQRTLRTGYGYRRLFYWLHTALIHVALFGDDFFRQFTARTARNIAQAADQ